MKQLVSKNWQHYMSKYKGGKYKLHMRQINEEHDRWQMRFQYHDGTTTRWMNAYKPPTDMEWIENNGG